MIRTTMTGVTLLAVVLTTLVGVFGPGTRSATAADLPTAVTSVEQEEAEANRYSRVTLHIEWAIPDGAATGDTFRVTIPREYEVPDGLTFSMKDEVTDKEIGKGTTLNREVQATLTGDSADVEGSSGTITLRLYFDTAVVDAGQSYSPKFTTGGGTFTDTFTVPSLDGDPNRTYSFLGKTTETSAARRLGWGITAPGIAGPYAKQKYTFVFERRSPNYTFTCTGADAPYIVMGDGYRTDGSLANTSHPGQKYPPPSAFTTTCAADKVTIVFDAAATDNAKYAGLIPGARGFASVTEPLGGTYEYTANLSISPSYSQRFLASFTTAAASATASGAPTPTLTPSPPPTTKSTTSDPTTTTPTTSNPTTTTPTTTNPTTTTPTTTNPTTTTPTDRTTPSPVSTQVPVTAQPEARPVETTPPSAAPTVRPTRPAPPVTAPTTRPGPVPAPRATQRLLFQVDTYDVRRRADRRALARILADRRLGYREDRSFWGRSTWETVEVRVPAGASPAAIRRAVNAATRRQPDVTTSATSIPGTRRHVTIAWRLADGARLAAPWGPRHNLPQYFVARG